MSRDSRYDVRCSAPLADLRDERHMKAILYAFLAAVFYAINIPASKILLRDVGPTTMAALLYLGAGIGIAGLSLFNAKDRRASAPLSRKVIDGEE